MASHEILIKRAYETAARSDGYRVLVDRLWPRGLTKQALLLDDWDKDLAPSTELRKWFGHEPRRWADFEKRYRKELSLPEQRERLRELLTLTGPERLTLVYGAKDPVHNHAVVLQAELQRIEAAVPAKRKARPS
jgi:uncharacterized protein YeaO (DUF488 family)